MYRYVKFDPDSGKPEETNAKYLELNLVPQQSKRSEIDDTQLKLTDREDYDISRGNVVNQNL